MGLYGLARPLLFGLEPERAHGLALRGLERLHRLGLAGWLARPPAALPVNALGLNFPNPVGLAAGFDKDGEFVDALFALGFGFVEIGTVTPRPQPGNPRPRIFRLPARQALINRLGFNNRGLEAMIERVRARRSQGILGINIGKNAATPLERAEDDYVAGLRGVYPLADYIAINVSSPNTEGLRALQHGEALRRLLATLLDERDALAARHGVRRPLVLKLAPDLDDEALRSLLQVLNERPPDGVCATNTTIDHAAVAGLRHGEERGGLSGEPLRERADAVLKKLASALDAGIGLIGVGGIVRGEDAAAKVTAGASLVQFYTGFVYRGPRLIGECVEALRAARRER